MIKRFIFHTRVCYPFIILWMLLSLIFYWSLTSRANSDDSFISQFKISQQLKKKMVVPPEPLESISVCDTVHIALVCMGKCTRNVTPMLKSLLRHRQNPLHFHIVVDAKSETVVNVLFDTWQLPEVKHTCYNYEKSLSKLSWIPNAHYSGTYGLVKLLILDIIPEDVAKVIVLDSDLTFLSDVGEVWRLFEKMKGKQCIGLVENESDWYLKTGLKRWPALGPGFNTGVMLLDLNKMRTNINWQSLWGTAAKDNLIKLEKTQLADQDIINAVLVNNPELLFSMTCVYNVQMSVTTFAKACYGTDVRNLKILHWNSPMKLDVKIKDVKFFRSQYQMYESLDGYLLRYKMHTCVKKVDATTEAIKDSDQCRSFRFAQNFALRTHLYFMEYTYMEAIDNFDVTLVLQLSMDRLQFLERLVKRWEGPLSAAIYLSDSEVPQLQKFIQEWSQTLSARKNIGYHLVFKHDDMHYPVNFLRNVALEHVNTPYVFLSDVDFLPMNGLYKHLRYAVRMVSPYAQKKCLVVPAFEMQGYRDNPPKNKAALISRLSGRNRTGDIAPFRAHEWPKGHRATNYSKWVTATKPYEVEWQTDYEPYLVAHRSIPKYDTRFSGFGWNKVSHSVSLRARGWRLIVLPDAFTVHTAHAPSHDITAFRQDQTYRVCLALLKQEFMEELKKDYNVTFADEVIKQNDSIKSDINQLVVHDDAREM